MSRSANIKPTDKDLEKELQHVYQKNRSRLVQQNRQLHSEIFKLQNTISVLLGKEIKAKFSQSLQVEKFEERHKEMTRAQNLQMKKLKRELQWLKNSQRNSTKEEMRKALDDLHFFKKEKEKYIQQKQALSKKRRFKDEALLLNQPLQVEKKSLLGRYKQTLHENNEYRSQIVNLERQIRKCHHQKQYIKQNSQQRTIKETTPEELAINFKELENLIASLKAEIREVEKQWSPRIESLDREYFTMKKIKKQKETHLQLLEKQLLNYETRVLVIKDEAEVYQNRLRVSRAHVKKESSSILQKKANSNAAEIQQVKNSQAFPELKGSNQSKDGQNKYHLNQFSPLQESPLSFEKSENKMLKKNIETFEVGVGTTFYYPLEQEDP